MKRRLSAIALVLSWACSDPSGPPPKITALPRALTASEQQLIAADNRFALKLLKQATADTRDTLENLFVSPLSVAMALGMTYNGAAGTTEEAMRATLELEGMSVADVNESYRSLIKLLRELDPRVRFQIANSIWYLQGYSIEQPFRVLLQPQRAGSELLELAVVSEDDTKLANVVFAPIQDRRGRNILSVRDQNTFDESLRKKRLMSLIHLYLIHRYKVDSVHYVTPTDDNRYQTERMKAQGIYREVNTEVGQIIVADVNAARIEELMNPDRAALGALIRKESPVAA